MDKAQFEAAVKSAVEASASSGSKWRALERVFSKDGIRGSGVLHNQQAERRTRIRQLFTTRKHPGFPDEDYSQAGVVVLVGWAADKQRSEASYLDAVVADIIRERPPVASGECIDSVLIMRTEPEGSLTPLLQIEWGDTLLADTYKDWYPDLSLRKESTSVAGRRTGAVAPDRVATSMILDPRIKRMVRIAIASSPAVILVGPPGTGKSLLLDEMIAEANANPASFGLSRDTVEAKWVTPEESWTTRDLLGGDTVDESGRIRFRPGHVLESIRNDEWLVLDEANRAA